MCMGGGRAGRSRAPGDAGGGVVLQGGHLADSLHLEGRPVPQPLPEFRRHQTQPRHFLLKAERRRKNGAVGGGCRQCSLGQQTRPEFET